MTCIHCIPGPVLATAGTNAAADNLLEGLALVHNLRVVRVGQPASVREGLRHLSLAALAEATPEGQQVRMFITRRLQLFLNLNSTYLGASLLAGQPLHISPCMYRLNCELGTRDF